MAKIAINPAEPPDLGKYGYTQDLVVWQVLSRDELGQTLEQSDASLAQARLALAGDYLIRLASNPDGTGLCLDLPMHAEDAAAFPVGTAVTLANWREQVPGYGRLVALWNTAPAPKRKPTKGDP